MWPFLVLLLGEDIWTPKPRGQDHEKIQAVDAHLQAKQRGLRRNEAYLSNLFSQHQLPELWENTILFEPPTLLLGHGRLSKLV